VEALPDGVALDRLRLQPDTDTWVDVVEPSTPT
jgi:hypothetical protein